MNPSRLRRIFATASCAALLALSPRTAQADGALFSYTKIQFPAALWTDIGGLNNAGRVVGSFLDAGGKFHGFLFDGTSYSAIDFPDATETYAFGIDAAGRITGSYATAPGPYHSFILDGATFTSFDFPGAETDAQASNSSGQIVGIYDFFAGGAVKGYVKTLDQYTSISAPGAADTGAYGINDAGFVSGSYKNPGSALFHGFAYAAGSYLPIDVPGAIETFTGGINNLNVIAGWSRQGPRAHGLIVSENRYRLFDAAFPGVTGTWPRAINDLGHVAGVYSSPDCPSRCGFLAVPAAGVAPCDQVVTMNYSGGTLTLNYTLSSAAPSTFASWLFFQNQSAQLWSIPVPAISSVPVTYPLAGFPQIGRVVLLSMLSTAANGTICADVAVVETGSGAR